MRAAVITSSDSGAKGIREDKSGPLIKEIIEKLGAKVVSCQLLPDEQWLLSKTMAEIADRGLADLILTTGGTGCSARDCMPEATLEIVERQVPGIPEAMRAYSMQFTGRAMLSRAMAGIRKKTLIVNLPGSPKAVQETLEYIYPQLVHGIDILTGAASDCARKTDVKVSDSTQKATKPPVVAICGKKNSGKTTCMEQLISILNNKGYKVAAIKHDGHEFQADVPGTDSYRMQQAGAEGTAVFSQGQLLLYKKESTDIWNLRNCFPESDLILVEGMKASELPKYEIVRQGISTVPVSNPVGRLGILTDVPQLLTGRTELASQNTKLFSETTEHLADRSFDLNDMEKIAVELIKIIEEKGGKQPDFKKGL